MFQSEPYPGIGHSLKDMQQAGLRIDLATSKRAIFARRILEHLELDTYFNEIYGSVPSGELDHKPELLAHIVSEHNLRPSHGLMVGDRRHDIIGAHAVGMRGLGVLWGYGSRQELETAGADQLVELSTDLARAVLSMTSGRQPSYVATFSCRHSRRVGRYPVLDAVHQLDACLPPLMK